MARLPALRAAAALTRTFGVHYASAKYEILQMEHARRVLDGDASAEPDHRYYSACLAAVARILLKQERDRRAARARQPPLTRN